ncbi:MAG: flagellar basal body rod protein FlgC [Oligoflexales bacterium]|nr:flagellar basal body rod protein FlgC [Oligoflexales bacterium]
MSDFFKSLGISSSALAAQRLRMNILSTNLANAQTTRTPEGGPYKRQDVVFSAVPLGSEFEDFLDESMSAQLKKVEVIDIHHDMKEPRMVFDPSHADADEKGYVAMPNVQVMSEMVNMIAATRAYEANITAFNEAKSMAQKTLEIGK